MDNFDNIYCINLPKSTERKHRMIQEFKKLKIDGTFIPAVSPVDENFRKSKRKYVDTSFRVRCHCPKQCNHPPRPLRETEIAICFSHLRAYKKMVENGDKISLIVEDDVVFHKDFAKLIEHLFETRGFKQILMRNEPIMAFCGGRNNPELAIKDPKEFDYHLTRDGFYSNYCCIINRAAAKLLRKRALPVARPDDSFKRNLIAHNKMIGYHIRPSLVGELSAGVNMKPIYVRFSKNPSTSVFRKALENPTRNKHHIRNNPKTAIKIGDKNHKNNKNSKNLPPKNKVVCTEHKCSCNLKPEKPKTVNSRHIEKKRRIKDRKELDRHISKKKK